MIAELQDGLPWYMSQPPLAEDSAHVVPRRSANLYISQSRCSICVEASSGEKPTDQTLNDSCHNPCLDASLVIWMIMQRIETPTRANPIKRSSHQKDIADIRRPKSRSPNDKGHARSPNMHAVRIDVPRWLCFIIGKFSKSLKDSLGQNRSQSTSEKKVRKQCRELRRHCFYYAR